MRTPLHPRAAEVHAIPMKPKKLTPLDVERELAALETLTRKERRARWQALYPNSRAARLSRDLVLRALAYHIQEQAYGGLDALTRRRLARAAEDLAAGRSLAPRSPVLKPGTRLLREWQGVVHEVVVLEHGKALYRGETWPSLSAIAEAITGAHWSGPRFFGLKDRRRARP
jgi:hypothetical protein